MLGLGLLCMIVGIGILAAKAVLGLAFIPIRIGFGLAKLFFVLLLGIPLLILGVVFAAAIPFFVILLVLALIAAPVVLLVKALF